MQPEISSAFSLKYDLQWPKRSQEVHLQYDVLWLSCMGILLSVLYSLLILIYSLQKHFNWTTTNSFNMQRSNHITTESSSDDIIEICIRYGWYIRIYPFSCKQPRLQMVYMSHFQMSNKSFSSIFQTHTYKWTPKISIFKVTFLEKYGESSDEQLTRLYRIYTRSRL